jgi:hypothetical protein
MAQRTPAAATVVATRRNERFIAINVIDNTLVYF